MQLLGHFLAQALVHGLLHGSDDILIAGAAAQMSREELAKLVIRVLLAAL